ncbi:MAG: MBL fold metallo-hydrolase, partial [Gemmatimonadota bacterium]|nr:MBL fold metallo-hydrolase [Gemmatimonadota bacterium]
MLLRRLYHDPLAQAGYLIACQATKEAIVVDPLRDPAPYIDAARQDGVRITYVTETHIHADFLSGAADLARASGARLLLSGEGPGVAGYDHAAYPDARWLCDGDRLLIGRVRLDVMHVPGHTPEHIAFVVTDTAAGDAPMGIVSGDFLFVGDVGRPDLLEKAAGMQGTMADSARQLFASLERLATLPDYLQIWPGHGAGSACGKSLGAVPQSTLGYERRTNWALGVTDESTFVAKVLAGQPEPPAYFARMKKLNATGAPPLSTRREMQEPDLRRALEKGALAVDVRPPAEFAAGHLAGSINVPLGNSFLTWAGSVIPASRDVVLVGSPAICADAGIAMNQLHLIGLGRVLGVLAPERLSAVATAPLQTLPTVDARALGAGAAP